MQLSYTQMLAALRQAPTFLDANGVRLAAINSGGARVALDESITNVATLAQRQSTHFKGKTGELASERRQARALRHDHLKPIVELAKLKVPEIAQLEALRVPHARSNSTALVLDALSVGDLVSPYQDQLIAAGLAVDFLPRMRAAADRVLGAVGGKGGHLRQQVGATEAIDKAVNATRLVVNAVDALVRASLGEGDPLIGEWAKVVRNIRSALDTAAPATVVPAPVVPIVPVVPSSGSPVADITSITSAAPEEVKKAA